MTAVAVKRVFLVGCPRSGTTLLQSIVGAHPLLTTFPETHFFPLVAGRGRRARWGLVDEQAQRVVTALSAIGMDYAPPRVAGSGIVDPRLSAWTRRFVRGLDRSAAERGATGWVEKTPRHLRYIDTISRHLPNAEFIHLVRDGRATVASLVKVRSDPSGIWGEFGGTDADLVENSARRWAADLRLSHACIGRPGHLFLRYENLVADPAGVTAALFEQLAVPLPGEQTADLLARRSDESAGLSMPWESWKAKVTSAIQAPGTPEPSTPGSTPIDPAADDVMTRAFDGTGALLAQLPFVGSADTATTSSWSKDAVD